MFEIKGIGGKQNVLEMASRIVDNNIPNSLCAIDRDYDDVFGMMTNDPRIFYTHGYGAENDLFGPAAARVVISAIIPGTGNRDRRASELWEYIEETIRKECHCLRADQIAWIRGRSALNRGNPTSVLDLGSGLPLRFRRTAVRAAIKEAKLHSPRQQSSIPISAMRRRVPAHLYFEIFYHSTILFAGQHTAVKYNKESIKNIVISSLVDNFIGMLPPEAKRHYRSLSRRNIRKYSSVL